MKKRALIGLIFCLIFVSPAFAALDLELTQGIEGSIPVAVEPFAGSTELGRDYHVDSIVALDLQNSGRFRLVAPEKAVAMHSDGLVTGSVMKLRDGRYRVHYQLKEVIGSQQALLDQHFIVQERDLRRVAHIIADAVYEKLTGEKGVFSTQIAYVLVQDVGGGERRYMLEVADADGFDPSVLVTSREPIMSPTWSPNGSQLAYVSFEDERAQVFTLHVASGERTLVSSFAGINGAPAWSPDGKQLALVLTKHDKPKIFVLRLADGRMRQVTFGHSLDTEPAWSPDGGSLVFTSNRGGSPQIYKVTLANNKVERMTFVGGYNARASFTPDGKHMVMLHRERGMFNIALQDVRSGTVQILTQSGHDESPSVAPNGRVVLYATRYGGQGVLSIVSMDGRLRWRLPAREGDVREPAWSPLVG